MSEGPRSKGEEGLGYAETLVRDSSETTTPPEPTEDLAGISFEPLGRYRYGDKKDDVDATRGDRRPSDKGKPPSHDSGSERSPVPTRSSEIGRGGLGRVLIAFDSHLGREIALKELLPHLLGDSGSDSGGSHAILARFLREARVTAQLEHPNIVPVYELGKRSDGTLYYTMKLVRGRTLSFALKSCVDLPERLKLLPHFVDLCQAIAYAHSRGVVHRDIKPQNVMVGEFGETMVLDWGLAKIRGKRDLRGQDLLRGIEMLRGAESVNTLRDRRLERRRT